MSKPAVVFGGPSPEHDISILTGLQAARTLVDAGLEVHAVYWAKTGRWYAVDPHLEAGAFADGVPDRARELRFNAEPGEGFLLRKKPLDVSVVVNCCHGAPGEDGSLQAAFDLAGLRYTGPDAAGSNLGMDKLAFGAVMASAGVHSIPRYLVAEDEAIWSRMRPPYIVKPRFGGSSIGIEVVADRETALDLLKTSPHMRRGAVVEPFLEGCRDYLIAVRTYPELQLSAIEAPVRDAGAAHIYNYAQKYLAGGGLEGSARELPADLPAETEKEIRRAASVTAGLVGVRSVARVDFLVRDGEVWINEINTIPGSLAAYLWIDPPVSRRQLLFDIIAEAEQGTARSFSTSGADGTALRNAASIASKLG
jgi:D-alanine-D-alanine ligase